MKSVGGGSEILIPAFGRRGSFQLMATPGAISLNAGGQSLGANPVLDLRNLGGVRGAEAVQIQLSVLSKRAEIISESLMPVA